MVRIAVASGKGGTGKTSVAVNLALSLDKVQLLDCDVEEPNDHLFIDVKLIETRDVTTEVPRIDLKQCDVCRKCAKFCEYHALAIFSKTVMVFDELCHGCGGCAIVCPKDAITYTPRKLGIVEVRRAGDLELVSGVLEIGEPKATPVVVAVKAKAAMDRPVIIDVSPGAGCPVVASIDGTDYTILVTEPTPFGLHDLRIAVDVCRALHVDFGVIINRDGIGNDGVDQFCKEAGIEVLMRIPQSMEIARLYSKGIPFTKKMPEWTDRFRALYSRIEERVASKKAETGASGVRA